MSDRGDPLKAMFHNRRPEPQDLSKGLTVGSPRKHINIIITRQLVVSTGVDILLPPCLTATSTHTSSPRTHAGIQAHAQSASITIR